MKRSELVVDLDGPITRIMGGRGGGETVFTGTDPSGNRKIVKILRGVAEIDGEFYRCDGLELKIDGAVPMFHEEPAGIGLVEFLE